MDIDAGNPLHHHIWNMQFADVRLVLHHAWLLNVRLPEFDHNLPCEVLNGMGSGSCFLFFFFAVLVIKRRQRALPKKTYIIPSLLIIPLHNYSMP
jgi:hypothetical protein